MMSVSQYFHAKGYEDPMTMMRYYNAVLDGVQLHAILDPVGFPRGKSETDGDSAVCLREGGVRDKRREQQSMSNNQMRAIEQQP
jgi:hypothetical protein